MNDEKYTYRPPPAHGPLDQEWIALEEDIAALTDYFIAALEGNESKSSLRRMWKQETDIIRSRCRKQECGACTGPDPLDVLEQFIKENQRDLNEEEGYEPPMLDVPPFMIIDVDDIMGKIAELRQQVKK